MKAKLYEILANFAQAHRAVHARGGTCDHGVKPSLCVYASAETIAQLCAEHMPSGSGFDNGTTLDLDASSAEKLVFDTAFHHMNDMGMYDGWTEHRVYVAPSLIHGIALRITGRDRNGIKDYIYDAFLAALDAEVDA